MEEENEEEDDDEDDDEEEEEEDDSVGAGSSSKPRHVLTVHEANQKYRSSQFASHSLPLRGERVGRSVDGMGPARAARENSTSPQGTTSMDDEAELAQKTAARIRMSQNEQMMGLISPTTELDDEEEEEMAMATDEQEDGDLSKGNDLEGEDFVIPRSMREIYRISNRNRRNKKATSPGPEQRAGTPANERELEALAKAEEVLKARSLEGKNYFEDLPPGSPKRQRTKSSGTASLSSDEAAGGHDSGSLSREDDVALMQEIGWIKGKDEVETLLRQRRAPEGDEGIDPAYDDSEDEDVRAPIMGEKPSKPTFDYSAVGPIGAFNPGAPPSTNPFFTGAATAGGHLAQQFGKMDKKKNPNPNSGKGKQQSRRQVERPEKRDGRAQVYKKR